jgi:hypothetical protein
MGIIQEFVAFAETLEGQRRADIETVMRRMMEMYSSPDMLTLEQQAEDDRRFSDPKPKYATQAEIDATCGRPMPS